MTHTSQCPNLLAPTHPLKHTYFLSTHSVLINVESNQLIHDPSRWNTIGFEPRSRAWSTDARVRDGPVDAARLHFAAPMPSDSRNSPTRRSSFLRTSEEMATLFEVAFMENDCSPNLSSNRGSARHGHRDALMMATPRLVEVRTGWAALAAAEELQSPSPRAVGEVTSAEDKNEA